MPYNRCGEYSMVFYHLMSALGYKTRWASISSFYFYIPFFYHLMSELGYKTRWSGITSFPIFIFIFVLSPHVGNGLQDAMGKLFWKYSMWWLFISKCTKALTFENSWHVSARWLVRSLLDWNRDSRFVGSHGSERGFCFWTFLFEPFYLRSRFVGARIRAWHTSSKVLYTDFT